MPDKAPDINPLFLQLVLSLQSAAAYQMGKTVSPISGDVERDLAQARVSIDLLVMLQEKTNGNLLDEEKRILDATLYNLQMNYLDEVEKDNKVADKKPAETGASEEKPAPGDESGGDCN